MSDPENDQDQPPLSSAFTALDPLPPGYEIELMDIWGYRVLAVDPTGQQPPLYFVYGREHGWYPMDEWAIEQRIKIIAERQERAARPAE